MFLFKLLNRPLSFAPDLVVISDQLFQPSDNFEGPIEQPSLFLLGFENAC